MYWSSSSLQSQFEVIKTKKNGSLKSILTQKPPFKIQKVQVLFCISDNTETNYRICKIFTGFLNTSTISTQTNCTRFWFRAARDRPHLLPPTSAQLRPTPGLPIAHLPDLYRRAPEVFFRCGGGLSGAQSLRCSL